MTPAISVAGLRKSFGEHLVLDDLDLVVPEGSVFALLGPNGAGKTTTLLMLLGAILPDEGTVEVLGHPLPKERSEAMEGVGFAAGYLPLPERLKVKEVLAVFANLYGIADPEQRIVAALERFRIAHLADAMATELSSGQRTLVGIVKATLHRPQLLVLDEPTASLDPDVAEQVRVGVERQCNESGAALLVTSHNMTDVERICERVVFVAAGRVVADGTPAEVMERFGQGNLEEVFLHLARPEEG